MAADKCQSWQSQLDLVVLIGDNTDIFQLTGGSPHGTVHIMTIYKGVKIRKRGVRTRNFTLSFHHPATQSSTAQEPWEGLHRCLLQFVEAKKKKKNRASSMKPQHHDIKVCYYDLILVVDQVLSLLIRGIQQEAPK